jgi:transketolase
MNEKIKNLQQIANELRVDILSMLTKSQSGHPGGSLSVIDILTTIYFEIAKNSSDPNWEERDRVVLSKGHASPALFSVFAKKGYINKSDLMTFRQLGSKLQGHPDKKCPGVEVATGSLGHGLSMANGIALGFKLDKKPNRVFAIMGDGEIQEGEIWEGAMASSHYNLDNLVAVVDHNHLQIDGDVAKVMNVDSVEDKFRAFGWYVITVDGHDFTQLYNAFKEAEEVKGKPTMIVALTTKGKGVSFMENNASWHGTTPTMDQFKLALKDLNVENFDFSIFE